MIPLTGPPRIAGILRTFPALSAPMAAEWDDSESITRTYASGRHELVESRWRLTGTCTWEVATEQQALALVSDLRGDFLIAPRTKTPADPEWADEVEVVCRRTSRLPATRPLFLKDGRNQPRWRVELAFESVAVYDTVPGIPDGGWDLTAEGDDADTLTPYGDATEPEVNYPVSFRGQTYPLVGYDMGSPAVVAMRVADIDDLSGEIQTRTP